MRPNFREDTIRSGFASGFIFSNTHLQHSNTRVRCIKRPSIRDSGGQDFKQTARTFMKFLLKSPLKLLIERALSCTTWAGRVNTVRTVNFSQWLLFGYLWGLQL